jgi:glucose-6-phosphate 1-dehydrogenase
LHGGRDGQKYDRRPQVVVLFGATGDLARRKLLPGLYHLASRGLHPGLPHHRRVARRHRCRRLPPHRRGALDEFFSRKITRRRLGGLRAGLDYVPLAAGRAALLPRSSAPSQLLGPNAGACTT